MRKKEEVCILAASGMIGSGFNEETFARAMQMNPDAVGCDAGSTDPGPYYLGIGIPRTSKKAAKRDLSIMIKGGVAKGIPVIIGSAGTAGADPQVDWTIDIVRQIAAEENLHFKLAEIKSEITAETLLRFMKAGKMKPLKPDTPFVEKDLETLVRCVGVAGAEPFVKALEEGAQVIIAGRSSDTSIYASVAIWHGFNNGPAWHAAKLLECGAACAVSRPYPDCMLAWIREDSLSVEPPNPVMRCTPVSCVSHTLYENSNPFILPEPSGCLNTTNSRYEAESDRRVRISGSIFEPASQYTVKLEGVQMIGYRRVVMGGIKDPLILRQLDSFLETCKEKALSKACSSLGLGQEDLRLRYIIYGDPKSAEGVGILWELIAKKDEDAEAAIASIWHTLLHVPIKEWTGLQTQFAYPFSPPSMNGGVAYRFCLNHVLEVDDPLELFRFRYYDL